MKRAPLSRLCLRNGAHTTYAYDRGGRLTRLANAHTSGYLGVSFDYEYDANSNITRIAQDFNGVDVAHEYAYDELNRLTREKTCDYDDAYSYDNVGNRTALTRVAGGVTKATAYSHNAAHELTQLVYDENGTAQYTKTYGYDAAGRTTRVTKQGGGLTTVVHTYDWDAADRLTRAQVDTGGNVKTIEYAYNAAGLRVRRVDTSTNVTKLYSYQGHNLASIQKSQSGAYTANEWAFTVAPGMISNALERHQVASGGGSTTSQYYQYDHRGNVVAVTDSSGDIQYGYQYDAFGNIMFSFDEGGTTAPTDDILFTGKDLDPDTGLYYFNARWYDSEVGRFVIRAIAKANYEHSYSFCDGNPVNFADPQGTVRVCCRSVAGTVFNHCYFEWQKAGRETLGLYVYGGTAGIIRRNDPRDSGGTCGPELGDIECCLIRSAARQGTGPWPYDVKTNNSNRFVAAALRDCGIDPATAIPGGWTGGNPGWFGSRR